VFNQKFTKTKFFFDSLVKLNVIKDSDLSGSELKTQINETIDTLNIKENIEFASRQCETVENKISDAIFDSFLTGKEHTLEYRKYLHCIMKYVADNELLPMKNFNLGEEKLYSEFNCDQIIAKAQRNSELNALAHVNSPNATVCVSRPYTNNKIFNAEIMFTVLNELDFSEDVLAAESPKIYNKLIEFAEITRDCLLAEKSEMERNKISH